MKNGVHAKKCLSFVICALLFALSQLVLIVFCAHTWRKCVNRFLGNLHLFIHHSSNAPAPIIIINRSYRLEYCSSIHTRRIQKFQYHYSTILTIFFLMIFLFKIFFTCFHLLLLARIVFFCFCFCFFFSLSLCSQNWPKFLVLVQYTWYLNERQSHFDDEKPAKTQANQSVRYKIYKRLVYFCLSLTFTCARSLCTCISSLSLCIGLSRAYRVYIVQLYMRTCWVYFFGECVCVSCVCEACALCACVVCMRMAISCVSVICSGCVCVCLYALRCMPLYGD